MHVSFCPQGGVCAIACWDIPPPLEQIPLGAGTPLQEQPPRSRHPHHPLGTRSSQPPGIQSMSSQYAWGVCTIACWDIPPPWSRSPWEQAPPSRSSPPPGAGTPTTPLGPGAATTSPLGYSQWQPVCILLECILVHVNVSPFSE